MYLTVGAEAPEVLQQFRFMRKFYYGELEYCTFRIAILQVATFAESSLLQKAICCKRSQHGHAHDLETIRPA